MPLPALLVAASAAATASAPSAAGPLATDRPGNGNAATTVSAGRFQLETSAQYLHDDPVTHQLTLPTALRVGVLSWLEVRALSGLVGLELSRRPERARPTDTALGLKAALPSPSDDVALATNLDVFLPTGLDEFTASTVVPEWRGLLAWSLPASFTLLLNGGLDLPEVDEDRTVQFLHVVNLGYGLPAPLDRAAVFVESFGRHPTQGAGQLWQVDAGVTYLLTDDLQLDAFSQHGLTDAAPTLQVAVGVSARF